jgi:beta-N-acetylhexosaminidase
MARRRALAAVVVATVLALAGCAVTPPTSSRPAEPWAAATAAEVDPTARYVEARLEAMTLEQRIASLFMVHVAGHDPVPIRQVIDAWGVAGVILMGDNVVSVEQVAALTAGLSTDPGLPVLTGIDQEGGTVRRLPDSGPGAAALRVGDPSATRAAFTDRGALVSAAGVTMNFGIVADVTADRRSFIFARTYGPDPGAAGSHVAAAVAGERGQVLSTLKHFPGHGAAPGDSHSSVPTTEMGLDEWRATQAPPFAAGIDAGAELVMLGHLRYAAVDSAPASLSATWVDILRDELGFDGLIVTDDMVMLQNSSEPAYADPASNAVASIGAGATLLLYVGPVDVPAVGGAIAAAVRDGRIPADTIDDAARRLLELRRGMSTQNGPYVHCGAECRELAS